MFAQKFWIRILIKILLFYQTYDLLNDYFNYHFIYKLDFDISSKIQPSITICIEEKYNNQHHQYWENNVIAK